MGISADIRLSAPARTLRHPTAEPEAIAACATDLLAAAMPMVEQRGITLLGLTVTNLEGGGEPLQLALPLDG